MKLSAEDRAAIAAAIESVPVTYHEKEGARYRNGAAVDAAIYRAGLERAAEECDRLSVRSNKLYSSLDCAAAIRALLKD